MNIWARFSWADRNAKALGQAVAVAILTGLLLIQARAITSLLAGAPALPPADSPSTASRAVPRPRVAPFASPPARPRVPDLTSGYLFNPERRSAAERHGEGKGTGEDIDLAQAFYSGSVIRGDERWGILSFLLPVRQPFRGADRAKLPRRRLRHLRVRVGDVVSGYTVTAIEPDRLVLSRGGTTVEKPLHEQGKEQFRRRPALPQPVQRPTPRPAPPPTPRRNPTTLPPPQPPATAVPAPG